MVSINERAVLQAIIDLSGADAPGTAAEIAAKAELSIGTTRKHIRTLRQQELIGEEGFVSDDVGGGMSWGPTTAGRAIAYLGRDAGSFSHSNPNEGDRHG